VFSCNVADVTITPSEPNKLQSPSITAGPALKPALDAAAEHLRAGRTVAFPTETVYGLGAHSLDPAATAKIYAIKNRPADNPLIMHVSSLDMLQRLLPPNYVISELYNALIAAYWPGPLTLLFPSANPPPPPAPQTNAIRVPNHPLALALIAAADLPVSAPSANSSGRPSPTRAAHVVHDLDGREGLGCILDGGPCGVGVESTVVDGLAWKQGGGGSVNVLRPGGLGVEDIARVVQQIDAQFGGATDILLQGRPWVKGSTGGGAPKPKADGEDLPPSTPGMKYRHYSPTVPVQLLLPSNVFPRPPVVGAKTDAAGVVRALVGSKRVGLLHYDDSPLSKALEGVALERRSLGKDATSAAQHLFDGLLALEGAGVDAILVEGCSDDGLGLAVMERVGKAVGGGGVTGGLDNGQVSTPGSEGRFWVEV
jgi:L-threonylcarbamoyladenylate synthase